MSIPLGSYTLKMQLDPLVKSATGIVCKYNNASPSLLQRRLKIGYARASRLIDQLECLGIIGYTDETEPRKVLIGLPDEADQLIDRYTKKRAIKYSMALAVGLVIIVVLGFAVAVLLKQDNLSISIKSVVVSCLIIVAYLAGMSINRT